MLEFPQHHVRKKNDLPRPTPEKQINSPEGMQMLVGAVRLMMKKFGITEFKFTRAEYDELEDNFRLDLKTGKDTGVLKFIPE